MIKNLLGNAGDTGLIPGRGTRIPCAVGKVSLCVTTREAGFAARDPACQTKARWSQIHHQEKGPTYYRSTDKNTQFCLSFSWVFLSPRSLLSSACSSETSDPWPPLTFCPSFFLKKKIGKYNCFGLPWSFSGKESSCQCRRCGFDPWVRKIPCRRKWQPTPVFLPGESHGQRSLVGHSPWGRKRVGYDLAIKQIITALQCCLSFCCKTKWISTMYTYIPSRWDLLPFPPSHPSRSSQGAKMSSWCYTAASHYLFYTQ